MEEHEVNKKKIQPRSISSLPPDLISEILLKLPAKSLVRFRCVSKLWSSIITDLLFIKSFETRLPSLLICFQEVDKIFSSSIPQHHEISNEYYDVTIDHSHEKLHETCYFSSTQSVHGFICFQRSGTLIVWNPSIKQFLKLPKVEKSWEGTTAYLGYDPIEGKHKVVSMYNSPCDWCWVLTLGSAQKEWRKITTNHKHHSFKVSSGRFGRCINGVIYYPACNMDESKVIMSFDVRTEKFDMIKLPADTNIETDGLITYEGRLACCVERNSYYIVHFGRCRETICHFSLWNEKVPKDPVAPFFINDPSFSFPFQLRGMTTTGELVYSPNLFYETVYVLFYDPKRKRFKKVKCEGMADELRLGNRFNKDRMYLLHTFFNHTESLRSL